mmetsp:Transcript_29527/g.44922  ORF Transcript_29527/g.44922 Transcript_29527/m.44922 type:complete len:106 (-) Transcript_29527:2283-2600(-)
MGTLNSAKRTKLATVMKMDRVFPINLSYRNTSTNHDSTLDQQKLDQLSSFRGAVEARAKGVSEIRLNKKLIQPKETTRHVLLSKIDKGSEIKEPTEPKILEWKNS